VKEREDRWTEGARTPIGTVEPEWWLRMACGQLAEEASTSRDTNGRRALRRTWTSALFARLRNRRRIH